MLFKEYLLEDLKRYWTITEVAQELKIQTSTIRYWEQEFPKCKPKLRYKDNGWRKYTLKDRNFIHKIHDLLHVQRYTIEGAKKVLNG